MVVAICKRRPVCLSLQASYHFRLQALVHLSMHTNINMKKDNNNNNKQQTAGHFNVIEKTGDVISCDDQKMEALSAIAMIDLRQLKWLNVSQVSSMGASKADYFLSRWPR